VDKYTHYSGIEIAVIDQTTDGSSIDRLRLVREFRSERKQRLSCHVSKAIGDPLRRHSKGINEGLR
jgi:hypothetical protein